MENYITKSELDNSKTYDKYVDVAVKTEKGEEVVYRKLPAKKSDMMDVLYRICGVKNGKITNVEILNRTFKLKYKWL